MKWRRRAAMGAAIAGVAAACSSFDEPPTTPVTSDGGDAGSASDGPTGGDDGGGGGDASSDADASRADGGCMPVPSGCTGGIVQKLDFSSTGIPVGWTEDVENGSILTVPKPGPCSAEDGFLRARTTVPNDAAAHGNAYWAKTFGGPFTSGRIAFAFRGPKPVASGYANLGCVLVLRGPTNYPLTSVRLTLQADELTYGSSVRGDGGNIVVDGGGTRTLDQAVTSTTASQWHTIDAKLVIGSQSVTVSPTYDGVAVPDFTAMLVVPNTRASIECGIDYSDEANASYEHDLDDAFIELCP